MKPMSRILFFAACALASGAACAQPQDIPVGYAIASSAQSSGKLRDTLPSLHEWLKDMEKAGIIDRSLPRQYRVAFPIAQFGPAGPTLKATYASMPGASDRRGPVIFLSIPID